MSFTDRLRRLLPAALGGRRPPVVAVLRLEGVIGGLGGLRPGLTIAGVAGLLDRAFKLRPLSAVALVINSPGGAAAQSALIYQRIRLLADEKKVPVFAFCEDVAASGGYMLAIAADRIFAHPMSIVGSIGVVSGGFGFEKAIEKLGIERRLYTAGENKRRLDPFLPEKAEDIERLKSLQADVHTGFKDMVKARRGAKLTAPAEELFNGDVWIGQRAVDLGLIDGVGEIRSTLKAEFGDKLRLVPIAPRGRRLFPFGPRIGAEAPAGVGEGLASGLIATVEARGLWSRFGL